MAIDIGRIAFEKYSERGGTFMKFLKWEELGKVEQDAWRAAGVAVIQHIDEARKQIEDSHEIIE